MNKNQIKDIDQYLAGFSGNILQKLNQIRETIRKAAPEAEEAISYKMPTFKLHGNLVHFAAHAHHIGFYPAPSGIETFKEQLSDYKYSKGAVQLPNDQPLPLKLIEKIVRFRVLENIQKARDKAKK